MPSFRLLLPDSSAILIANSISHGKPIVLFDFSPWCPYCRAQIEEIIGNMKSLTGIKFCLLTTAPLANLKEFYNHYQLGKYPNIVVGKDYTNSFGNYFKADAVPYIAIYTSNNQLKQVLLGKSNIDDIKTIALE